MTWKVLVSATMAETFAAIPPSERRRIRRGLQALAEDPFDARRGVDAKRLRETDLPKHRLRVGEYRVIYRVEGAAIKVLDVFRRERGYRE